ncbi:hypothetical protein ZWY2020_050064 [Hordeum vulgare]|nr:hypothetical protein ZWY2020_050064 [Hordeum vulgare]
MDQSMGEMRHGAPSLDLNASGPVCSAHPGESQASMSIAVGEEIHGKDFLDDDLTVSNSGKMHQATKCRTRRLNFLGVQLDGGDNVLPIPHEASHSSSLATAIDEASVLGQGPIARCAVDDSRDGTQIAALEEHVYIEEGTGDFDPMVAGVCCAKDLVLDDGDNASCVGAVDDKADEDDAESRPTKRAKL